MDATQIAARRICCLIGGPFDLEWKIGLMQRERVAHAGRPGSVTGVRPSPIADLFTPIARRAMHERGSAAADNPYASVTRGAAVVEDSGRTCIRPKWCSMRRIPRCMTRYIGVPGPILSRRTRNPDHRSSTLHRPHHPHTGVLAITPAPTAERPSIQPSLLVASS
jgi:hypothetical protein